MPGSGQARRLSDSRTQSDSQNMSNADLDSDPNRENACISNIDSSNSGDNSEAGGNSIFQTCSSMY